MQIFKDPEEERKQKEKDELDMSEVFENMEARRKEKEARKRANMEVWREGLLGAFQEAVNKVDAEAMRIAGKGLILAAKTLSETKIAIEENAAEVDPLKLYEDLNTILGDANRSLEQLRRELQRTGFYDVLRIISDAGISPMELFDPTELAKQELKFLKEAGLSDQEVEFAVNLILEIEESDLPKPNSRFWQFKIPGGWIWGAAAKLGLPLQKWQIQYLTGYIVLIGGLGLIGYNFFTSATGSSSVEDGLKSVLGGLIVSAEGWNMVSIS